ncbi:MAG: oligosaccharide flippase family protein, partial [Candidatus Methanomethylicaceae archaeon]
MNERNSFKSLITHVGWATLSQIFLTVAGFGLNVVLGNVLGESGFGIYSLAMTIYMLTNLVFTVGIPIALTKYAAEFVDNEEINAQYYTASLLSVLITSSIGAISLFLLRGYLAHLFRMTELAYLLPVLALGIPFLGLGKTAIASLNGKRWMWQMAVGEISRYVLLLSFTVAGILWASNKLYAAVWSLPITDIVILPILLLLTKLKQNWSLTGISKHVLKITRFGWQVVLARIFEELDVRSHLLMAGLFLPKDAVGLFSLASLMSTAIPLFPGAVQKVTGPAMTEMYAKGEIRTIESLVNQTMRITAFLLTWIAVSIAVFFKEIITFLYASRPGFLSAETAFLILATGAIFYGITVSISPIMFSIERPDITFKVAIIRLILSVVLTIVFVKPLGINGVAIGGAGTGFLVFIFWTISMKRLLAIRIDYGPLLLTPLLGYGVMLIGYLFPLSFAVRLGLVL